MAALIGSSPSPNSLLHLRCEVIVVSLDTLDGNAGERHIEESLLLHHGCGGGRAGCHDWQQRCLLGADGHFVSGEKGAKHALKKTRSQRKRSLKRGEMRILVRQILLVVALYH